MKKGSLQPGPKGFLAVIPQFLLLDFVFGSFVRFADPGPRAEVPSLVLQGRGVGGGVELCERTKFNGPQHETELEITN